MIAEYIRALLLIFAAEMGDKTQILAMMFATKYKTRHVLVGIALGSFLNHGLAVAFGVLLGQVIQVYILQMIAGIAFIAFALWTLATEEEEEEDSPLTTKKKSAIMIVAMAFFVGELGDKTQLTAITLSLDAMYPVAILMGTVTGMLLTSSLGILVGSKIGDRLPETLIKVVSSGIFLIFGVLKLWSSTPSEWVRPFTVVLFVLVVGYAGARLFMTTWTAHKNGSLTPYSRAAKALYDYAHRMKITADEVCRGVKHCGTCQGEACAVGFIRHLTREIINNNYDHDHLEIIESIQYYKDKFDHDKLEKVLELNARFLTEHRPGSDGYEEVALMQQVVKELMEQQT